MISSPTQQQIWKQTLLCFWLSFFLCILEQIKNILLNEFPGARVLTGHEIIQEIQSHQRAITRTMNHAYPGMDLPPSLPTPPPSSILLRDHLSTPDGIVPSSSPECEEENEPYRLRGLKLITDSAIAMCMERSISPTFPVIRPTPRKGINFNQLFPLYVHQCLAKPKSYTCRPCFTSFQISRTWTYKQIKTLRIFFFMCWLAMHSINE